MVRKYGFTDTDAVKTAKGTFVAPFVNAEETQYLVIEDWFPNGRVEIGGAYGVMYADRETVDKVERMKVCTLSLIHICGMERLQEIADLRRKHGCEFLINVDGGIDYEKGRRCKEIGVDVIVGTVHNIFRQPEGLTEACRRFNRELG